jgi:hypothetical protein
MSDGNPRPIGKPAKVGHGFGRLMEKRYLRRLSPWPVTLTSAEESAMSLSKYLQLANALLSMSATISTVWWRSRQRLPVAVSSMLD